MTLHPGTDSRTNRGIALDASHVYWSTSDAIYRLRLP